MPHMPDVYRAARRVVGDPVRAEDLTQEVYLEAWKSFHRYQPGTNCRAWLMKILFYRISHQRRLWKRIQDRFERPLDKDPVYVPPVEESISDAELLGALDRLTVDARTIVLLVDVEEFSYKEAAEVLGIPAGTVMSRLSRARRQLRTFLTEATVRR